MKCPFGKCPFRRSSLRRRSGVREILGHARHPGEEDEQHDDDEEDHGDEEAKDPGDGVDRACKGLTRRRGLALREIFP
jgi:hypothetical protein